MRSIYYHLKKGVETGELVVKKVEREKGEYSWGEYAEKIYYSLGPQAKPSTNNRVKDFLSVNGK